LLSENVRSIFLTLIFICLSVPALAQSPGGGSQDSSLTDSLRPRSGAYLVGVFPSPTPAFTATTVQFYNLNPVVLSCKVFDMSGRDVFDVVLQQEMPGGLHTYSIPLNKLCTGCYNVRLTTYTADGNSIDLVDNLQFLVIH
jgi:hypothetical protein